MLRSTACRLLGAALAAHLAACSSPTPSPDAAADAAPDAPGLDALAPDAPGDDAPRDPVTVTLFERTQFSFADMDNRREQTAQVIFPAAGPWQHVTLHLSLACPSGRCDPWDRLGALRILDGASTAGADGGASATQLEFARFVTPYGVAGSWDLDVTDLQPLFTGARTVQGFVDTWVGPGSMYGNGWLLTATLEFTPGRPDRVPVAALPLGWTEAVYGDPERPIPTQLVPRAVPLPARGFSAAALYVIATGHGQGNRDNCAEFCPRTHSITVDGGAPHQAMIWRDDCGDNPISNQRGTWQLSRAGWCPGDIVHPWIEDLGTTLTPGTMPTIGYDVESYVNSCRPGVTTCTGCSLGTGCAYDGGNHTEPVWKVTGYVVLYE